VLLILQHPELACRSCDDCRRWQYNHETGEVTDDKRRGGKMKRQGPTPCELDPKDGCAKGHWRSPGQLSQRNQQAYQHYLECKAVSIFPDDAIVRRNAGIIRQAEDLVERHRQMELNVYLKALSEASMRMG